MYVTIAMKQICSSIFEFVKMWEPNDLDIWFGGNGSAHLDRGEDDQHVFRRSYVSVSAVEVGSLEERSVYLTMETEWLEEYISQDIGEELDCFVEKVDFKNTEIFPID